MKKLAIITTHPIQYNAPLFRLIAERKKIKIKVFYTWENSKEKVFDKKFGKEIKWDIPLLEGYEHTFVKNISQDQGSHHFKGIDNPTLNSEIENWQADAVLIYGWNFKSHLSAMRYFKGKIPVYFRGDSTLVDVLPPIRKFLRWIVLSFVYRSIDYAFYVGTNNKKYFLKYGLKENQLIFAPHAIDNSRFENKIHIEKGKKIREDLGFAKNDTVILFAGKFETIKNPMLLIEATKKLPDFKFLFVGNGQHEAEMKKQAGINVKFMPFQNQTMMPAIYNACDIYCLPSQGRGETWGLAINEAMACSKAIVASTKVGSAVDLVKDGENGFIFKSGDLEDLIKKIKMIENNTKEFGKKSLEIIKDWSFEKIAQAVEKNIDNIKK